MRGDSKDLGWKTTFLDLVTEQRLLEEYTGYVEAETEVRRKLLGLETNKPHGCFADAKAIGVFSWLGFMRC